MPLKKETNMNLIKPKAIIFDWDSTLAITRPTVIKALEQTLAHFNKAPWEQSKSLRQPLLSLKDNFPLIFGKDSNEAYQYYLKIYQFQNIRPSPHAQEFLEFCQAQNIDISIVSNKEKSLLLEEVNLCYPDIRFSRILGHGDTAENKPSASPVYAVLKNAPYPINPENVWLIGDSMPDTECAYNANIQPILVGHNIKDKAYLKEKRQATPPLIETENFNQLTLLLNDLTDSHINF